MLHPLMKAKSKFHGKMLFVGWRLSGSQNLIYILSYLNDNMYKLSKIATNVWKMSFPVYTEELLFSVLSDHQKKNTSASFNCS